MFAGRSFFAPPTPSLTPRLTLVTSDRSETLVERLAADLARAPLSPFENELVIVQSQGTARWLRNELATRQGCAASIEFPFPAAFCHRLARDLAGDADAIDPAFTRDALTWRILELLESGIAVEPAFEPLRTFLGSGEARKRLGLAARIAARFDDYQLYRADTLLAWEAGGETGATRLDREGSGETRTEARAGARAESGPAATRGDWQRALWVRLCGSSAPRHLARWFTGAVERLEEAAAAPAGLPTRISVFGVSTLPPLFIDLLRAAGRFVPVRMYVAAPPRATWLELDADAPANPLYAAFGHTSRDLLTLCAYEDTAWEEHHAEPCVDLSQASVLASQASVLTTLQSDVRRGVARGREPGLAAPARLDPADTSLTLHSCHAPLREMEVLRDQLFAAFEADPTLRPHDVLLMVPDVPAYAPLVEAVFGVGEPELPRIPHRIADRPLAQESSLAGAVLRLLHLVGARCTAAEVMELFDVPAVRRAAGVTDAGAEHIARWIADTRIRWARDGAMRRDVFRLPALEANSWRAGLDRLLMGYAVGAEEQLVSDILPHAGHTIGDPETLGAFAHWVTRLFDTLDDWHSTPRSLQQWSAALHDAVCSLFHAGDVAEAESLGSVLGAIMEIGTLERYLDPARALDLAVVRDWLERTLGDDSKGGGFLVGGMTVCALKPMRAIPFRIIAVAGLDDASFPRRERRSGYDLLDSHRDPGDPDRRADDRQLFLDTILAARERLILTYVGRSAKDNKERAVSVVVAELLDIIDRSFDCVDAQAHVVRARDMVTVHHRLQPFSPAYYGREAGAAGRIGAPLFSYSRVNARATAASLRPRRPASPFVTGPLQAGTGEGHLHLALEDLVACWTNPSRFFCERAIGMRLPGDERMLDDCEPLDVDGLTRYTIHDRILHRHLAGSRRVEDERREAVARGELPPGLLATAWFDRLDAELAGFLAEVGAPTFVAPEVIRVDGAGWTLTGRVDGITERGRTQLRASSCKNKDLVRAWVTHVALTAARGPVRTIVLATDRHEIIDFVDHAADRLQELIDGYRAARVEPLPFLDQASLAYVDQERRFQAGTAKVSKPPLVCAREKFQAGPFNTYADEADPYVALAWRGRDPFADEAAFARWSGTLWNPLLDSLHPAGEPGAVA